MPFRCFIGIHKWKQNRKLAIYDIHPPFYMKYGSPTRECEYCGLKQEWLPGYGGSEIGCWLNKRIS